MLATAIGVISERDHESREHLQIHEQPSNDLEGNQLERLVLRFMVGDLLQVHPGAMLIKDDEDLIPFEKVLLDWVNEGRQRGISNDAGTDVAPTQFSYSGAMNNVWESTAKLAQRTSSALTDSFAGVAESPTAKRTNNMERGDSRSAIFSPDKRQESESRSPLPSEDQRDRAFPGNVQLTPQARYAFTMLSACLDHLERYQSPKWTHRGQDWSDARGETYFNGYEGLKDFEQKYGSLNIVDAVAHTMASIPDIMSTIMLIENDVDRVFALSTSLCRRIMLSKWSVGPWLTKMLQSRDPTLAQSAVDYLKRVSDELTKSEPSSGALSGRTSSNRRLTTAGQESPQDQSVIDEVCRLQDFVPSLLGLNERGIEDASTTYIVKQVLGRMISRPFAVTVILCDVLFLSLLIIGFRYAINKMIEGASVKTVLQWIYIANTGIFYFIIREIGKTVSFFLISTRARRYFLSFWNLIDATAVLLALVSTIAMRSYFTILKKGIDDTPFLRILLAVATGFLWLRVLSLLKAINIQLATFVLAILQIAKDIVWFCVILVTLVISFAQMFFTLLAPNSCATGEGDEMKCKSTEYMLRVYTILLGAFGNFERKQFVTAFSVFLVVIYSFLVTVVLLNVLIAVASDSYEKCLLRSQHLFGRARVMLIAELVAFQNLLQRSDCRAPRMKSGLYSRWKSSGRWIQHWSRASVLFFSLSVTVIGAWTVAELVGYSRGEQDANILFSLASVFVNVFLFAIIIAFLAAASAESDAKERPASRGGPVLRVMRRLLGVSKRPGSRHDDNKGEWNGRVDYLECQMRQIADEQMALMNRQAKILESLVSQTEMRLKAELTVMEENFSLLRDGLLEEVKGTKIMNQNVTIALQELKNLMSVTSSID
jgi:hypothetical protein